MNLLWKFEGLFYTCVNIDLMGVSLVSNVKIGVKYNKIWNKRLKWGMWLGKNYRQILFNTLLDNPEFRHCVYLFTVSESTHFSKVVM